MYASEVLMTYEKAILPSKNVVYSDLLNEYYDGILLFEVSNRLVWSKANTDSVGLSAFYENNKTRYMWGERMVAELYYCKNPSVVAATKKALAKADKKNLGSAYVLSKINAKDADALKIDKKLYSHGENQTADGIAWVKGTIADITPNMFVRVKEIRTPEPKQLNECRGAAVADYQKHLEADWINELRAKYSVTVNKKLMEVIK